MKRAVLGFAAALCLLPVSLAAQAVTGTILGVITDTSGSVMPGVTVTLTNAGTGLVRVVVTDNNGEYTAPSLPTGRYVVKAELPTDLAPGIKALAGAVAATQNAKDALVSLLPVGLGAKGGEFNKVYMDSFQCIVLRNEPVRQALRRRDSRRDRSGQAEPGRLRGSVT